MTQPRSILHVDMDAFFASVEQLDHPEYRGCPVIVGADPRQGRGRGVVAACSYEARGFGVHSALPISQAWRRCPHAMYVRPRGSRYGEVSRQVFELLGRYTDLVEPLSIDEAFLDVTGSGKLWGDAESIGRALQGAIRDELGLEASVGIAPNKFVAKIASDLEKPRGFVVVPPERVAGFLAPLPITRLWGVGPKTAEQLRRLGLTTIGAIAAWPAGALKSRLGEMGEHLWHLARGEDSRPVVPHSEPKSLGCETTFDADQRDPAVVRNTLLALSDRLASRLRRRGLLAQGLSLKYRDAGFHTWTRAVRLVEPTELAEDLHGAALELLERVPDRSQAVRLLGLSTTGLVRRAAAPATQLGLFVADTRPRRAQLAHSVDALRERFGRDAVVRAALLEMDGDEKKR
ncbi:MAG: DNA polymerase IV [Deferrisomatales bacterium]|nr:DNA polymerase IV [Deferrisomatales bacterium]